MEWKGTQLQSVQEIECHYECKLHCAFWCCYLELDGLSDYGVYSAAKKYLLPGHLSHWWVWTSFSVIAKYCFGKSS